jgi:hypothetical protein
VLFVFEQAALTNLAVTELALQNPERMFDRRADSGEKAIDAFFFKAGFLSLGALDAV